MAPPHGWMNDEPLPSDESPHPHPFLNNSLRYPTPDAVLSTPAHSDQESRLPMTKDADAVYPGSHSGNSMGSGPNNKPSCPSFLNIRSPGVSRESSTCTSALSIGNATTTPIAVKPMLDDEAEKELQLTELSVTITDLALAKFDFSHPLFLQIHSPSLWTTTPKVWAQQRTIIMSQGAAASSGGDKHSSSPKIQTTTTTMTAAFAQWTSGMQVPLDYPLEIDVKMQHSSGHKLLAQLVLKFESISEDQIAQYRIAFDSGFLTATFRRPIIPTNSHSSFHRYRNTSNNNNNPLSAKMPSFSRKTDKGPMPKKCGCFGTLWRKLIGSRNSRRSSNDASLSSPSGSTFQIAVEEKRTP